MLVRSTSSTPKHSRRALRLRILSAAIQRVLVGMTVSAFIPPVVANAQQANAQSTLPIVVVTSEGDIPESYAGGQVAKGAQLGLLGNLDIMDIPFNVVSYTSELIGNQQARTLADVLANDPSVRFTTSSGHMYENFRIRGFDVNQNDIGLNGMYGLAPLGHVPVEFLDRVEVLKGPNALFSGMAPSGAVGGTINLVTKHAGNDAVSDANLSYQSGSQLGAAVDIGRRFGANKEWGIRINGVFNDGGTELDGQTKKREFVSTGLDYRNGGLKLSLDAYHSKESFSGGTAAMYWFATTKILAAPSPSLNQFRNAYGTMENNAAQLKGEYRINDHLSVFAGVGTLHSDSFGFLNGTHARSISASGNYTGYMVGQRAYTTTVSAEAGLRSNFKTGSVGHELTLQATNLELEEGSASNMSSFSSNIYNPVTATMPALPSKAYKTSETTLSSLALVDSTSLLDDRLHVIAGLRNQQIKTKNFSTAGAVTSNYDKSAITPSVGIVIKPWSDSLSFYANYVQGLSKGDSVTDTLASNYGKVFAPYKTEQREVGVKWNAGSFAHTLSMFQIDKPTLVALGSSTSPTYSDEGEKRVRGLEWETFGELTRGVRLLGGATLADGVMTKTAYNQYNGNTAVGAPRLQGNLGVEWDAPWMTGLTLSSRVQATSSQYLNAANTQEIPGWAQFDVGARYTTKVASHNTVWRLNVANIFNRYYYSGSFSDSTPIATLGQARTVSASVSVSF